ncbi:MAG: laccase domain-containing protein, partial [Pseudomonadota bacterium]
QASYEVGPEFAQRFLADDPNSRTFFRPGPGDRQHFDLTGYVHRRLERAGVGHIDRLDIDTCTTEAYFSNRRRTHRGEPDYGRNASVIALSP